MNEFSCIRVKKQTIYGYYLAVCLIVLLLFTIANLSGLRLGESDPDHFSN